jgi:hypothetical protein
MKKTISKIITKIIINRYLLQRKINRWMRSVPYIKKALALLTLFKAGIQLKYAIMEANKKHAKHNRRFYVIPNMAHRLITCDRAEIRKLRTKGYFGHDARIPQFFEECFYCTPHAFGRNPLSNKEKEEKRLQWLDYILQAKNLT